MYLIAALAAAVLFAASTVLKHRSAQVVGSVEGAARTGLPSFIRRTVRHPAWLSGIAIDAAALALQIVALHLGPIAAVQPLLAVSVVVALLLDRRHVPAVVWAWAALLVGALAGFVVLSGTSSTTATPDDGPALISCLLVVGVVLGCLAAAPRLQVGLTAAMTLGLGVGITYAASAALLKVLGNHAVQRGLLDVLGSWQLYAVIVCGFAGVLLNQLAFSAGPLRHSLPTISAVDPVVSVALGVVVFDERLRLTSGYGIAQLIALVLVVAAIVKIGRAQIGRPSSAALVQVS